MSRAVQQGETNLGGQDVWRLYDTFGFPVDLTRFMAEEIGLGINEEEFRMAEFQSGKNSALPTVRVRPTAGVFLGVHDIAHLQHDSTLETTDDTSKSGVQNFEPISRFSVHLLLFSDKPTITANVKAIICDRRFIQSTSDILLGTPFGVILDRTNFFAESGGQVFDTGRIYIDGQSEFEVEEVHSYGGYILHTGYLRTGILKVGDSCTSSYDLVRKFPSTIGTV